jgi:hypothetical protein
MWSKAKSYRLMGGFILTVPMREWFPYLRVFFEFQPADVSNLVRGLRRAALLIGARIFQLFQRISAKNSSVKRVRSSTASISLK